MDGICSALPPGSGWVQSLFEHRDRPVMFCLAVLVASLNITDAMFTDFILAHGGSEVNPIARAAIVAFGDLFWLWKHTIVSLSVIMLISHIHLRMARVCLALSAFFYGSVTVWHLILIDSIYPFL